LGFQSGAIWVRLKVDKVAENHGAGVPRSLVLRVGPNYLDRIDVFSGTDGQWSVQLRGALHVQNAQVCADDMHCFAIEASSAKPTTVYLRIQHQGVLSIQTEVLPRDELPLAVAARVRNITLSLVIAMCLLFWAWLSCSMTVQS